MLNLDKFLNATTKDSQRILFELAGEVNEENRVTLNNIEETLVDDVYSNVREV